MLTSKQINTRIAGIKRSAKAIRENIQTVLVNIAGHAYEHGDVTALTKLLDATQGVDKDAILKFAVEHCFIVVKQDKIALNKSARKNADFASGADVVEYLAENAPNWYDKAVTTEQAVKALDIDSALKALAKRIAKADELKTIDMKSMQDRFEDLVGAYNAKIEASRTTSHDMH